MADHPEQAVTFKRRDSGIFTASVPIWQHQRARESRAGAHLRVCYASANRKHHEKNSRLQSPEETRQSLVPVYDPKMQPEKVLQDLVVFFATP
jgi:hypothetical protein